MSIRNRFDPLRDLAALLFPPLCPVCAGELAEGERTVCTRCRWEAPLTGFCRDAANPMAERLRELARVEQAAALLYFIPGGGYRELIHGFKYRGQWRTALGMGEWLGAELAASELYATVEAIVPVPLHLCKRLHRGYNQAEYIARGIGRAMGLRVECGAVVRRVHNRSQASRAGDERWANVEGVFAVRRPERLEGRHVLLVDDVFTTGATICSCIGAIAQAAPHCRVSVATLACSRRGVGMAE